jgi:hypothetical protein
MTLPVTLGVAAEPGAMRLVKVARDQGFTTKVGVWRRRLGRPGAEPEQLEAKQLLAQGKGMVPGPRAMRLCTAKQTKLGTGTVHNLKREMLAA